MLGIEIGECLVTGRGQCTRHTAPRGDLPELSVGSLALVESTGVKIHHREVNALRATPLLSGVVDSVDDHRQHALARHLAEDLPDPCNTS